MTMMRKPMVLIAAGVVLIAAIVLFFSWRATHKSTPALAATSTAVAEPAAPAISNPVPAADTTAPLPTLEASDAPLHDALASVIGKSGIDGLFKPEMLIRHMVVTIDNLTRKRVAVELRPTKPLPGAFLVKGDDQQSSIDPGNYQRYTPYVQVVQMMDAKQASAVYFHYYPLFQQAYQDLGYPNGYFNDRLVETIDNLLETPDPTGDIALVRPNVMYQFADPKLEQLSAGQKLLLRMGPQNEQVVKAKLRELRAELAARGRNTDRSRAGAGPG